MNRIRVSCSKFSGLFKERRVTHVRLGPVDAAVGPLELTPLREGDLVVGGAGNRRCTGQERGRRNESCGLRPDEGQRDCDESRGGGEGVAHGRAVDCRREAYGDEVVSSEERESDVEG